VPADNVPAWVAKGFRRSSCWRAGTLWSLGFAIFTVACARILVQRRIEGRPG
jgi:hypothetical protein